MKRFIINCTLPKEGNRVIVIQAFDKDDAINTFILLHKDGFINEIHEI